MESSKLCNIQNPVVHNAVCKLASSNTVCFGTMGNSENLIYIFSFFSAFEKMKQQKKIF